MTTYLDSLEAKSAVGHAIRKLSQGSRTALIASPYVSGDVALKLFTRLGSVKLLCNARSTASDPYLLQKLLLKRNIEIRSLGSLHAKIYCFDNHAIIASANATPNGIGDGFLEAASSVDESDDLFKVRNWFMSLWESLGSEKVADYPPNLWKELESKWKLSTSGQARGKQKASDLIRARSLPHDMVFCFYNEQYDAPSKKEVKPRAEQLGVEGIPNVFENWDYWIEGENYDDDVKLIDPIRKAYFSYKCANFVVKGWPFTKVLKRPGFYSTILDKAIKHEYRGKSLCLSFYRTDIAKPRISLDKEVATIVNESLVKNRTGWEKYFHSDEGQCGYCSVKRLYELLYH